MSVLTDIKDLQHFLIIGIVAPMAILLFFIGMIVFCFLLVYGIVVLINGQMGYEYLTWS